MFFYTTKDTYSIINVKTMNRLLCGSLWLLRCMHGVSLFYIRTIHRYIRISEMKLFLHEKIHTLVFLHFMFHMVFQNQFVYNFYNIFMSRGCSFSCWRRSCCTSCRTYTIKIPPNNYSLFNSNLLVYAGKSCSSFFGLLFFQVLYHTWEQPVSYNLNCYLYQLKN